jgi:hypothetical protein
MNSSEAEVHEAAAQNVHTDEELLTIDLVDGRTIAVPLAWFPRLVHGTPAEKAHWRLIGAGNGIHWPDLDEDISVRSILAGQPSAESQESLQRWLNQRESTR